MTGFSRVDLSSLNHQSCYTNTVWLALLTMLAMSRVSSPTLLTMLTVSEVSSRGCQGLTCETAEEPLGQRLGQLPGAAKGFPVWGTVAEPTANRPEVFEAPVAYVVRCSYRSSFPPS